MKKYRQLVESLPSKTVVFAFGRFNPPTTGHQLLVEFAKKLAKEKRADHVIYVSRTQDAKKNPLSLDRKLHYIKLMFPNTNFAGATDTERTFVEAAVSLNSRYRNLIMVAGSDRVSKFKSVLESYNGKDFNFDSIQVVSVGDRDPDSDDAAGMSATKMRIEAQKGDFLQFKRGVPSRMRDIDARRMMNDVREGMGLEAIKEQLNLKPDTLREKFFQGEIYNVGEIVESLTGQKYEIVKRGTNYLLCKDDAGNIQSKWIHEVVGDWK